MPQIGGVARNVRIEREGGEIVLRFVLEGESEGRVPVEMRGRRVLGVLDDGDRVEFTIRGQVRDRDGVARPDRIENLSTDSVVRVQRQGCLRQIGGLVISLALSILSGWLSTILLDALLYHNVPTVESFSLPPSESAPSFSAQPTLLPVAGVLVAVLVFFLIFVLPRLLRRRK
jgi:hypothetical protein